MALAPRKKRKRLHYCRPVPLSPLPPPAPHLPQAEGSLAAMLDWFSKAAAAADRKAHLTFAVSLGKEDRAAVRT